MAVVAVERTLAAGRRPYRLERPFICAPGLAAFGDADLQPHPTVWLHNIMPANSGAGV